MPQKAASDNDQHFLSLQQLLYTSSATKIDVFKIWNTYGNELRSLKTLDKYGSNDLVHSLELDKYQTVQLPS